MKKLFKLFKLLSILIIGTMLFTACEVSDNKGDDSIVKFTYDGKNYIYEKGEDTSVFNNGSAYGIFLDQADITSIFGYLEEDDSNRKILIIFNDKSIGDKLNASIQLNVDGTNIYTFTTVTLNITKYEEVGGYIEGEFSSTLNGKELTNGTFKVTRIGDS